MPFRHSRLVIWQWHFSSIALLSPRLKLCHIHTGKSALNPLLHRLTLRPNSHLLGELFAVHWAIATLMR